MKNKICLILIFLFSFIGIGAVPQYKSENLFYSLEGKLDKFTSFVENGVKVKYISDHTGDYELTKIKDKLIKNFKVIDDKEEKDEVSVSIDKGNVLINTYEENNKTVVEVSLINYDKEKNISKLMQELTNLQSNNVVQPQYFKYVKGKINNTEDALEGIKNTRDLKNINTLDIHNGYVGTAILYNGERVNFAVSSYNTGSYLIIGTPIIFTTY